MGLFDGCGGCCPSLCFRPKADNVTALDFSHHCLEDVPSNVFSHERTLEELGLDSNQIRDLPRALFHCEGLLRLNLSDNELQSIPSAVSSLTKLQELNISKNHILQIPDSIKSCKCLTVVDASINPLGPRLPDGFTQLINLEELYLNDAFLEFLPANFGRLSRLRIVELRENHLKVLPKSMSRLVELTRLDIGQNDFLEFPEVIGSLHKLSELWCDCNRILSVPDSIGSLKNLTYFDISYNKVDELSAQIGHCLALTDLTLTANNLIELPESIANLVNLNVLRIDENEIKNLSSSVGSLVSMEEFVFNGNEIESLPSNIGLLRNLVTLIGDCNRLTTLPASIGSCVKLSILSLAANQLKVIPDEIGRLSSLKVLNLNSNSLTYLPISLTKITKLQALWLSENQTKPLVQLQTDIDIQTNQKVLTCFLLPQIPLQSRNSPKSIVSPNDSNANSLSDKQMIKFSNDSSQIDDDIEDRITTKLIRAPTPYPKELKAHARHARNLALKQKEPNFSVANPEIMTKDNSESVILNTENGIHLEMETKSTPIEIKEAKVSKSVKCDTSLTPDLAKRPTSLPVNSSFNHQKSSLNSSHLELVANKISQLLRTDENEKSDDSSNKTSHERKGSYKVAVNNCSNSMKSPIEKRINSKIIANEDHERGYRSDADFFSKDKTSLDINIGYSSDCDLTSKRLDRLKEVSKEFDSDSALIQMPYESNRNKKSNFDPQKEIISLKAFEMKQILKEKYETNGKTFKNSNLKENFLQNSSNIRKASIPLDVSTEKAMLRNSVDVNSNSSLGSLYHSSGSERPGSVCSGRQSYNIEKSNGSANPSANTSQCSLSRNESTTGDTTNQFSALPSKPPNYAFQSESAVGSPLISGSGSSISRQKQPQTASSQFIFHKFSHDFYTQPKPLIGLNSTTHTVFGPEDIHSKNTSNGINLIDDSIETNDSRISNHSLNKANITSNRFVSNSSAHVFPVIIVKNPGLGFSIESGMHSNRSNDSMAIFVSSVEPAGSASTALKVGDQILQIDGIDLQNVTKDKANHIFESTEKQYL